MSVIDRWLPGLARFCLVLLFPFSALDKIFDYGSAVAQANASGMPMPGWLLLLLGGCLEVFGSLGILFNVYAASSHCCSASTASSPRCCSTTSGTIPSAAPAGWPTSGRS